MAFLVWLGSAMPAVAEGSGQTRGSQQQVYIHTLKHQQVHEALALIEPLLTANGTVEVQPGDNTLVIRETQAVVARMARLLATFDHPPEKLRFKIQIVRAGPKRHGISPPLPEAQGADDELSQELVTRLRKLLRYDDYRVLAEAGVTSRQGEEVTYALGQTYNVSFRSGPILAGRQVKLEGFRITKQASDKGRRLEPRELFHATLNLWIDQSFNLVLAHDETRQEALMVAISCHRESGLDRVTAEGAAEKAPAAGATKKRLAGSTPEGRPAEGGR